MNVREELLKNLNPDFNSSYDLADDFCGGNHIKLNSIIYYLRKRGWKIDTLIDGHNEGRGYRINRDQFHLLRRAYRHNRKRPKRYNLSPKGIKNWLLQ